MVKSVALRSFVVMVEESSGRALQDNYVRKWVDLKRSQRPIDLDFCVTRAVTQSG